MMGAFIIGNRIELSGGYDYQPRYLQNPPVDRIFGTIVQFIKGQNDTPAAVVKLDTAVNGDKIRGDIAVLEIRHEGDSWLNPAAVHIELCDFMPEDKAWKDRRQGEWIEAAASIKHIK